VQVLGVIFTTHYALHPPWAAFTHLTNKQRLQIDSVAGLLVIISGYNAFIAFIGGEGRRQVERRSTECRVRAARSAAISSTSSG
jgi:hypothetical protein